MQHLFIFLELLHELPDELFILVAVGDVLGDTRQVSQQADPKVAAQGGPGEECVQVPPQVQVVQSEPPAHRPQDVGHKHTLRHLDSASRTLTDRGPGRGLDVPLFTLRIHCQVPMFTFQRSSFSASSTKPSLFTVCWVILQSLYCEGQLCAGRFISKVLIGRNGQEALSHPIIELQVGLLHFTSQPAPPCRSSASGTLSADAQRTQLVCLKTISP